MKRTKRFVAMAAMLLAVAQTSWGGTPYRNIWVRASVGTGEGTVYMESGDANPTENTGPATTSDLKATIGENGTNNYECWLFATPGEDYEFQGFVTQSTYEAKGDDLGSYMEEDFVGTIENNDAHKGGYKVNVYVEGREGKTSAGTSDEENATAYEETKNSEESTWKFPEAPDHTFRAIFVPKGKLSVYKYADNQDPESGNPCGTIGTVSCNKGIVYAGYDVTLTATPSPGCHFVKWTDSNGDDYSTDATISFTASETTVFTAHFAINNLIIGEQGVATFSCLKAFRFSDGFEDVKCYAATVEDGKVRMGVAVQGVPHENGAIVIGKPGSYELPPTAGMGELDLVGWGEDNAKKFNGFNKLKHTASAPKEADGKQYALGYKGGEIGFYKVKVGQNIPQGKAYIEVENAGGKDFIPFADDQETTDVVNRLAMTMDEGTCFNLQGQQVDESYKGIIIKNGHKYINK